MRALFLAARLFAAHPHAVSDVRAAIAPAREPAPTIVVVVAPPRLRPPESGR